jgi:hypothetical protein
MHSPTGLEAASREQSAENMAYVRRLLRHKEPGFSEALELAVVLAALELTTPEIRLTSPGRPPANAQAASLAPPATPR